MKRLGNLWPEVVAFENLWLAWRKARRGKAGSAQVGCFELELEANLLELQRELPQRTCVPRCATGTIPITGTTIWVFVSPARLQARSRRVHGCGERGGG
jgi:hypothetical protein